MNKNQKVKLAAVVLIVLIGLLIHHGISKIKSEHLYSPSNPMMRKPEFHLTAEELIDSFNRNESFAVGKYMDRILSIKGVVHQIDLNDSFGIVMEIGERDSLPLNIHCTLDRAYGRRRPAFNPGDPILLTGVCAGLFGNVMMVHCIIEK